MLSDRDMRQLCAEAFRRHFGREGSRSELQCLQAVAWLETSYASGWKPPGDGSWNFGAMQAGASWGGASFSYTDTHPLSDGTSRPYTVKFRAYASAEAGVEDLLKIVFVARGREAARVAAAKADVAAFSAALHATGYYEGFGATVGERIAHHADAVRKAILRQCRALSEPLPPGMLDEPPRRVTLRYGMKGAEVRKLQEALRSRGVVLTIDGGFGPATLAAVKSLQAAVNLVPDGLVGPATWKALGR